MLGGEPVPKDGMVSGSATELVCSCTGTQVVNTLGFRLELWMTCSFGIAVAVRRCGGQNQEDYGNTLAKNGLPVSTGVYRCF
jgi:hypothetical protein